MAATGASKELKAPAVKLNNGLEIPALGFGTWTGFSGEDVNVAGHAVKDAIQVGYRHIDLSPLYGNEAAVGVALENEIKRGTVKRSDVFLTSKLPNNAHDPSKVVDCLKRSLADLRVEYLDLYLVHWPFPEGCVYSPEGFLATWRKMEELVDAGLVKSIGVSNMTVKKLKALLEKCRIKPVTNQVELHPLLAQNDLLQYCAQHGIVLTAYSPLGSPKRADVFKTENDPVILEIPTIVSIARDAHATPAQVLLAWARQRGTVAVPKSSSVSRMRENFESLAVHLSAEQMQQIDKLDQHYRLIKGDFCLPGQPWQIVWDEPVPASWHDCECLRQVQHRADD